LGHHHSTLNSKITSISGKSSIQVKSAQVKNEQKQMSKTEFLSFVVRSLQVNNKINEVRFEVLMAAITKMSNNYAVFALSVRWYSSPELLTLQALL
jgi:hypothetical protein